MGKVVVVLKIYPEDVSTDFGKIVEEIKKRLPEGYELRDFKEEPIAFGLKVLNVQVIAPEIEGSVNTVEDVVKSVEGVSEVETVFISRL